ncbi:hypothetical protein IFR05_016814 [Cadophora sp. M221]|nr:hypothetical protein IFR05_016814 [Cadophora sp. M221]
MHQVSFKFKGFTFLLKITIPITEPSCENVNDDISIKGLVNGYLENTQRLPKKERKTGKPTKNPAKKSTKGTAKKAAGKPKFVQPEPKEVEEEAATKKKVKTVVKPPAKAPAKAAKAAKADAKKTKAKAIAEEVALPRAPAKRGRKIRVVPEPEPGLNTEEAVEVLEQEIIVGENDEY